MTFIPQTSLIGVGQEEDETITVSVGDHKSRNWRKHETAAEVARICRIAYNQGRHDQRAEHASLLRSLLAG